MLDRTIGIQTAINPAAGPFGWTPLAPGIGAEIHGVDVSKPVSDDVFAKILDIWHDNCVILFRNQNLNEEQEWNFARRFGETGKVQHKHNGGSKLPGVMYISNIRENGELIGSLPDGEMYFHHDQCYTPDPAIATMLYAMEIPLSGGNTLFTNMFKVYEALSPAQRALAESSSVMHVYDYQAHPTKRGAEIREGVPHHAHPMVRIHPANGRKAVYVNRLMTDHICGMDREKSDAVLEQIFALSEEPRFIYEHVWTPGDLLIWDNRSSAHARTDFSASERRLMRRVAIVRPNP
ncbi:MAG: TauD/TfdA family dioxygenase [Alphaproteobacteria bacterium]|nr:TauD/TfdA family dioxygenase [Alphaproteobacteria bacterium]